MSDATFRTVAARLLEVAAAVLLVPPALELWAAYRYATGADELGAGPSGTDAFSWARLAQASTVFTFRGPIALLGAAALLLVVVVVVDRGVSRHRAGALRREVAVIVGLVGLFALFHLVAGTALFLTAEPDPGAPDFARLPEYAALPFPLVTLLLCGVTLLWWLRGGVATDEEPAPATDEEPAAAAGAPAGATDGSASATEELERAPVTAEPRAPADEWISSDGSSANGFDEYFRRR